MSVYNGSPLLDDSIRSVLDQREIDFELVIVNDGSTDDSAERLENVAARDRRVVVVHQENTGLTKALVRGCGLARGRHIARLDAGDVALPGRLKRQSAYLDEHPGVTLLSCWTRYVGPCGELLWLEVRHDSPGEATARLRADRTAGLRGISAHSSAMFRRADYIRAGGYRPQFWMAQDLDLWMRLSDFGQVAFVPECLCEYRYEPESLSGCYAREQAALTEIIVALRKRRMAGLDEAPLLEKAARIKPARSSTRSRSGGWYFLGRVLTDQGDRRGMAYLQQCVRQDPWHVRAWFWLLWRGITLKSGTDRLESA